MTNILDRRMATSLSVRAPSLARLTYQRLGFGARPTDPDFGNDWTQFVTWVDAQLRPETLPNQHCEQALAALDRADSVYQLAIPAFTADAATIQAYRTTYRQRAGHTPEWEMAYLLTTETYIRALLSQHQLFEVLVDFWTNHFNTVPYNCFRGWEDQYVIRPHVFGRFRDLLEASARSPLMLEYLSNVSNDGGNPNENYARELLELHTLGSVNRIPGHPCYGQPNYTEQDVHQLALIFSGWTTVDSQYGEFRFNDSDRWPRHDSSAKTLILDGSGPYHIPAGGMEQGQRVFDLLAQHPATAYRVAVKLARRLISDTPETFCPGAITAGMQAFLATQGDLRATVRALLLYQEPGHDFASSWGQKCRRPFEYMLAALRGLNAQHYPSDPEVRWDLYETQMQLGQQLFYCQPPTGYPDIQPAWWNTTQALGRWSLANRIVQLVFGAQPGPQAPTDQALDVWLGSQIAPISATQAVDRMVTCLLGFPINQTTYDLMIDELGGATAPVQSTHPRIRYLIATLLASPMFQLR